MSRYERRKAERQAAGLVSKAKKDMLAWVESIGYVPTEEQTKAWQTGYLAGINRMSNELKEEE